MTIVEREPQTEPLIERERRARILEAAALEVEVRGWTHGLGECRQSGAVCLLGAIAHAYGDGDSANDGDKWPEFAAIFGGPVFECGIFENTVLCESLYSWNDAGGRTPDEVAFLLRWRAQEIRDGR